MFFQERLIGQAFVDDDLQHVYEQLRTQTLPYVQADNSTLNGNYAAFGTVTSGMDVVDAICKGVTPTDSNGTIPASEQPVIESITMID